MTLHGGTMDIFWKGTLPSRHNGECISGKMGGIIGRGRLRMEQG